MIQIKTKIDPIIVIGAGIGGLSAAIYLAAHGRPVVIYEKNEQIGGKMGEFQQAGFRWDTGPSVITMRYVFEDLFAEAGKQMTDYLTLEAVYPLTRYFYPDGTILDASRDPNHMQHQIELIAPEDLQGYERFLEYASQLYRITSPVFINDQPPRLASLLKVSPLDFLKIDSHRNMAKAINAYLQSTYLQLLFARFATYVGADPYLAPATLNLIAHVEMKMGVWYPKGGVYGLARALTRLALDLGVKIYTGSPVKCILTQDDAVCGVQLATGKVLSAQAIVANVDVASVYSYLLPNSQTIKNITHKLVNMEPSGSAFIMLLGVEGQSPQLAHHNILFSEDYVEEFKQLSIEKIPARDPTIYIAITARSTPSDAPPGHENWFVLVNSPPIQPSWNWNEHVQLYKELLLAELGKRGLDIRDRITVQHVITPLDLQNNTAAFRGALYGRSSNNRWAAFKRPHNRAKGVQGLYFAGGTTHPGGGVPMVTLSGKVAQQMLIADGY